MKQPIVVERFTDNGEHSHWDLINQEDQETIWSEDEDYMASLNFKKAMKLVIKNPTHTGVKCVVSECQNYSQELEVGKDIYLCSRHYESLSGHHISFKDTAPTPEMIKAYQDARDNEIIKINGFVLRNKDLPRLIDNMTVLMPEDFLRPMDV